MRVVLDASALLAWLKREPGSRVVRDFLTGGLISAVNWSEVVQKSQEDGRSPSRVQAIVDSVGLTIEPATRGDAVLASRFWEPGSPLSLADRFCLALAYRFDLPAVTADRAWEAIDVGMEIVLIR
jgi:ribonuclease VapC